MFKYWLIIFIHYKRIYLLLSNRILNITIIILFLK